jgi:hypothetical protein
MDDADDGINEGGEQSSATMAPPETDGDAVLSVARDEAVAPSSSGWPSAPAYVYAIGRVEARFPTLAVEKEFAQVAGQADTEGLTDNQVMHAVLSNRENRYLARQLCWVFKVEGIETYLLTPRDPVDLELFVDGLRAEPNRADVDVVVGVLGPIASASACNGLLVPIVAVDNLYSFDVPTLVGSIPRPEGQSEDQFKAVCEELFDRISQLSDNAGATDEDRALNYLALRYPAIYHTAAEQFAGNASLAKVEVRRSPVSGTRNVVDAIFHYTNRATDVTDLFFVRIDVTEKFPFLVSKLAPYIAREP